MTALPRERPHLSHVPPGTRHDGNRASSIVNGRPLDAESDNNLTEVAVISRSAQLLNLEETALILGIGRSTIYRAVRDGKVPFPVHRIGERWYVPKQGTRAVPRRREERRRSSR